MCCVVPVTSCVMMKAIIAHAPSPNVRSVMRANRSKNTKPELSVRKVAFALGYRYRLHARYLPGSPDLVFLGRRKVIFVHGCFWHQHSNVQCPLRSHPRSNLGYWEPKLTRNVSRDLEQLATLRSLGWSVKVIWECETEDASRLAEMLRRFLGSPHTFNRKAE